MHLHLRSTIGAPLWRRNYSTRFSHITSLHDANIANFTKETPVVLKGRFKNVPAIKKWFHPETHDIKVDYFEVYGNLLVPLELTRRQANGLKEPIVTSFERLQAPLALLLNSMTQPTDPATRLYLAQCPLEDLPAALRADLPMPDLIKEIGKGDVYGSSLWMGLPPTRTPLHRDPNPNLFVQLAGEKRIRLMKPEAGKRLYDRVRQGWGHANMRGEEMMVGDENARLEQAVWDEDSELGADVEGWEAMVEAGDGLYIPLGWWHSVRGLAPRVNASVNWWFR